MFKRSKTRLPEQIICLADKGYQGIQKIHEASKIPHKKTKKKKLSLEQKKYKQAGKMLRKGLGRTKLLYETHR